MNTSTSYLQSLATTQMNTYLLALFIGHCERLKLLNPLDPIISIDSIHFWQRIITEILENALYSMTHIADEANLTENLIIQILQSTVSTLSLTQKQIENLLALHEKARPDLLHLPPV
jgi:hypothetical protein